MTDPLDILSRANIRKRRRLLPLFFGPAAALPCASLLRTLEAEFAGEAPGAGFVPLSVVPPTFFAVDVELDAVYAAFAAPSALGSGASFPLEDRRGFLELDGIAVDAVLGRRLPDGSAELVLFVARTSGRWASRRFRRIADRLRRVFGDDGAALPGVVPRFVALGPERPGPSQTSSWPRWMARKDGTSFWLSYARDGDELSLTRCDRKGRERRGGEYWRFG